MRNLLGIIIAIFVLSSFIPDEKRKRMPKLKALFACKQGGKISMSAEQFLTFMNQPLCVKDSLDSLYKIVRFDLSYSETGLYQDSAGLPIVHTDYSYASFTGDTLNTAWRDLFKEHAYKGDTIRFSNIQVKGDGPLNYRASNIELVLR